MTTYYIVVFREHNSKLPAKIKLKEALGKELEPYYDGFGCGPTRLSHFFEGVPKEIAELAKKRAKNYEGVFGVNIGETETDD